jgi:hypothetical protein
MSHTIEGQYTDVPVKLSRHERVAEPRPQAMWFLKGVFQDGCLLEITLVTPSNIKKGVAVLAPGTRRTALFLEPSAVDVKFLEDNSSARERMFLASFAIQGNTVGNFQLKCKPPPGLKAGASGPPLGTSEQTALSAKKR